MKKISVITPALNAARFLQRAIDSVVAQHYFPFEHIVVDGGSEDETLSVIKSNPHIKWISKSDGGQSEAMNRGYALSSGDIIVYLNSDDYFYPNVFHTVSSLFESGAKIVFGDLVIQYDNGDRQTRVPTTDYADILRHWKGVFPVNPVQYFYARDLQTSNSFNESNTYAMDHEFLLALCKDQPIQKVDMPFGVFDLHQQSKTFLGFQDPASYWSLHNFGYIDSYLEDYPGGFVSQFKNEQFQFYQSRLNEHFYRQGLLDATKLKQLLQRTDEIIVYGAGTTTKNIYGLIQQKLKFIVDASEAAAGPFIDSEVYPPEVLQKETNPTILVTVSRYRQQIEQTIRQNCETANILFLHELT